MEILKMKLRKQFYNSIKKNYLGKKLTKQVQDLDT